MKNEKRIYLLNANEDVLCALTGVEYETVNYLENLMDFDTFTFTIYSHVEVDGKSLKVPFYSSIKELMYVYISDIGRFRIEDVNETNDSFIEQKTVTCNSCECELSNQNLVSWKINVGDIDSLEYLADNNVDEYIGFAKEYITLYNSSNPQLSLLDLVLEQVPFWKVGYVDPLLRNKKFSFEIDSKPIYSFLMNELVNNAKAIIKFDTKKREINVYSIERIDEIGETEIFLSYRNLLNTIEIKRSNDKIYTRFNVSGADNLNISSVNFNENRIENLSHLLSEVDENGNPIYADTELVQKYKNWYDYRYNEETGKRKEWIELAKEYNQNILDISDVEYRNCDDILDYSQYDTFDKETLNTMLDNYIEVVNIMTKNYSDGSKDTEGFYIITETEEFENSIYYEDYKIYTNIIIPNVKIAIENLEITNKDDKVDYIDTFETDWELYGISELEAKIKSFQNTLDTLDEAGYSKAWSELTTSEQSKWVENTYNIYYSQYVKISNKKFVCEIALNGSDGKGTYLYKDDEGYYLQKNTTKYYYNEEWEKVSVSSSRSGEKLLGRKEELEILEEEKVTLEHKRLSMIDDASLENSQFGFTEKELNTLKKLQRDSDYVNNNILTTSLENIVEQIDVSEELFQDAMKELDIESQSQYAFNVSLDNLFNLSEFKKWHKDFEVGNVIHLCVTDLESIKLRIISVERNPMIKENNNLTITFSNMIKSQNGLSDYTELFKSAIQSSVSQITSTYAKNFDYESVFLSENLIKALANSNVFNNTMSNIVTESIVAKDGVFDVLTSKYIATDEFEARLARITELESDSAFIKYLESNLIVSNEIKVEELKAKLALIDVAEIGSVFADSLQTYTSTIVNSTVDSAYICDLIAGNINAVELFGKYFIVGDDTEGRIVINGSTMQFQEKVVNENGESDYSTYIQLGTDEEGNHSLIVKDINGTVILNGNGITEDAIADELIVDDMVKKREANYYGISANALNIDELGYKENEDGSLIIKASYIKFDETNQSLTEKFSEMIKEEHDSVYEYLEVNYFNREESLEKVSEVIASTTITKTTGEEAKMLDLLKELDEDSENTSKEITTITTDISNLEHTATSLTNDITSIQSKINSQVFTETPTPPYYVNDLWYTTDGVMTVKICTKERSESESFNEADWEEISMENANVLGIVSKINVSKFNQLDDKISLIVSDINSSSSITLTSEFIEAISENIFVDGSVTFTNAVQNQISENEIIKKITTENQKDSTTINGDKIVSYGDTGTNVVKIENGKINITTSTTDEIGLMVTNNTYWSSLRSNYITIGQNGTNQRMYMGYSNEGERLNIAFVNDENTLCGGLYFFETTKKIELSADYIKLREYIIPATDGEVNIGSSSYRFRDLYIRSIHMSGNILPAVNGGSNLGYTDKRFNVYASSIDTNGNVTVGGNIKVSGTIMPSANESYNIGSSDYRFCDLYLRSIHMSGNILPAVNGGSNLGYTDKRFNVYASSISVSGNATIDGTINGLKISTSGLTSTINVGTTYSSPSLKLQQFSNGINLYPSVNEGASLGTESYRFSYLYAKNINVSGTIMPSANESYNIGSSSYRFNYLYTKYINASGDINTSGTLYLANGDIMFTKNETGGYYNNAIKWSTIGANDYAKIRAGSWSENSGFLELAVGDDGNEEVIVTKYDGNESIVARLHILDSSNNTNIPNNLTVGSITVKGKILPSANESYNIGSSDYRFCDLYLRSIHMSGNILPAVNGGSNLGYTDKRFNVYGNNVYNSAGLITSSDGNKKKNVKKVSEDFVENLIDGLSLKSYKYVDGTSDRTHYGAIAQEVEEVIEKLGLSTKEFGGVVKSYPKKIVKEIREDGSEIENLVDDIEAEPIYGLRYEQFIMPLVQYCQTLKKRIISLEEKVYRQNQTQNNENEII